MFKTYVEVPNIYKTPKIIKDTIEIDRGWDIITIIVRPYTTRIYFSYRWFELSNVFIFKKAVENYVNKLRYQSAADTLNRVLAPKKRVSSEQFAKSISAFAKSGIQGSPKNSNK